VRQVSYVLPTEATIVGTSEVPRVIQCSGSMLRSSGSFAIASAVQAPYGRSNALIARRSSIAR